jgi:hypothetical protein
VKPVHFQDLLANRWLDSYGELLPLDKDTVAEAQARYYDGWHMSQFEEDMYRNIRFCQLLRTGSVFVVDPLDTPFEPFAPQRKEHLDLPPLPFPEVFFEFTNPEINGPALIYNFKDLDSRESWLAGIGIREVKQAAEWRVFLIYDDGKYASVPLPLHERMAIREYTLLPGPRFGTSQKEVDESELSEDEINKWLAMAYVLPITLTNLVSVLGVSLQPVPVPRPTRRRYERKHERAYPPFYRVDLKGAGEPTGNGEPTGRHVHVRFLVRGHYRREEHGEFDVPDKGRCGWVQSHVKGPPGAPWSGRQVRYRARD